MVCTSGQGCVIRTGLSCHGRIAQETQEPSCDSPCRDVSSKSFLILAITSHQLHFLIRSDAYRAIQIEADAQDAAIERLKQGYLQSLSRKHVSQTRLFASEYMTLGLNRVVTHQQLSIAFLESVDKLFKQGDDDLEGCIGAFEEILISEPSSSRTDCIRAEIEPLESARRPVGKTDGMVGKTLEGQLSDDIKLIREGDIIGGEDDDMQVEET